MFQPVLVWGFLIWAKGYKVQMIEKPLEITYDMWQYGHFSMELSTALQNKIK